MTGLIELGNKLALLVGINQYDDTGINQLNFSVKDIQDFCSILTDPEKGRYEKNNVKVLSDTEAEKPTRNNILSKLTTLSRTASSEDSILFYFSGHGAELEGKPYLLCSDSFRNTLEQTALSSELIRKTMEGSQARVKVIIIDACHSGAMKGVKESGTMTKALYESFFPPPEGFVVLSSCKLGEFSHEWEEKQHGVFSYYLLEGLNGNADKDGDGVITITDAHRYTSENVKRWAFQKGLEQNPTLDARISGDIPLVHVEKVLQMEQPVDKSVIVEIILRGVLTRDIKRAQEDLCGSLLGFFSADDITFEPVGKYKFPYGQISRDSHYFDGRRSDRIEVTFDYRKEHWDKIDKVIKRLDINYNWNSVAYLLLKRMNTDELVRKCKESSFEVTSFRPEKGRELVVVNTEAWLDTHTTFENLESGLVITIFKTAYDDSFSEPFYSTLSPENIIEFIKDCLE